MAPHDILVARQIVSSLCGEGIAIMFQLLTDGGRQTFEQLRREYGLRHNGTVDGHHRASLARLILMPLLTLSLSLSLSFLWFFHIHALVCSGDARIALLVLLQHQFARALRDLTPVRERWLALREAETRCKSFFLSVSLSLSLCVCIYVGVFLPGFFECHCGRRRAAQTTGRRALVSTRPICTIRSVACEYLCIVSCLMSYS